MPFQPNEKWHTSLLNPFVSCEEKWRVVNIVPDILDKAENLTKEKHSSLIVWDLWDEEKNSLLT